MPAALDESDIQILKTYVRAGSRVLRRFRLMGPLGPRSLRRSVKENRSRHQGRAKTHQ
jgi:hypothetical protein